jgi:hypothetical protein
MQSGQDISREWFERLTTAVTCMCRLQAEYQLIVVALLIEEESDRKLKLSKLLSKVFGDKQP